MKTSEEEAIVLVIFALSTLSTAVLTGYERQDITADPKFRCTWQGGSTSAVSCVCKEDTEEMYIKENSFSSFGTSAIEVNGCKRVVFGTRSIAEMRNLRNIHLKNIQNLEFEQSSLKWYGYKDADQFEERFDLSIPSLKVAVENSTISRISSYTFEGRINTIQFDGVTIENIDPFSFNALMQTQTISIKNSELKNIRLQPFKKFSTENLELENVKIAEIPSRFFSNVTVYEKFIIRNCTFGTVRPGAFLVVNPSRFHVLNTKIAQLDGEAFKVTTRGDVLFKNNVFDVINDGAFRGIVVNKDEISGAGATITFDSNVFTTLTRYSLSVSDDFKPRFTNLNINETCDCKSIDHNLQDSMFYSEIKCVFNDEFTTVKDYKSDWCSLYQSYSTTIIIVGVVLTMLVIIATVLVVYYRKVYLSKKYGSEKNSKKGNMSLIVPDGRTYRETELHVIVERADLLTTDL